MVSTATGRIIYVDDDGPADFNNIQAAINDANNGDTTIVADGVYTGPGNRDIDFLGKAITVRSIDPNDPNIVAATVIDCNSGQWAPLWAKHRGFYFHTAEAYDSIVDGFVIKNGYVAPGEYGGGIYCYSASPTISNCIIAENTLPLCPLAGCPQPVGNSGGIYCDRSSPRIIRCTIRKNRSSLGAGVYNRDSSPLVDNCIFSENVAMWGGGMYSYGESRPKVVNCSFQRNNALAGGGMYNHDHSTATVISCQFVDNRAGPSGGGVMNAESNSTFFDCFFSRNTADKGGAMFNGSSNTIVNNCIFRDNWAKDGGAIYNTMGSPKFANCLIASNSATRGGGFLGSNSTFTNCTFTKNLAKEMGGGLWFSRSYNPPATLANCIFWGNTPGEVYVQYGSPLITYSDVQGGWSGEGNINADPCFADPNNGDYHLKSQAGRWNPQTQSWDQDDVTSPCIDAGDLASPIGLEPFPNGGRINMGAYGGTAEASKSYFGEPVCEIIVAGDINGDCKVNLIDFAFMALHWLEER